MAVREIIESRAKKKFEADMMRKYELEAARELIQPFIEDLRGPAGRDGIDGKDGRDGIDGKDADSAILLEIMLRLKNIEERMVEEDEEDDDSEEAPSQSQSFGMPTEEAPKKPRSFTFKVVRDRNGLIKDIVATETE